MSVPYANRYRGRFLTIGLMLMFGIFTSPVIAQWSYRALPPPDVLSPAPSVWWIGPQAGVNLNTHEGEFFTKYCECSFKDGSGTGITAGIELGHMLSPVVGVAVKLLYNDFRADYAFPVRITATVYPSGEIVDIAHERQMDVRLGYLMLHPVLQIHPTSYVYLFAGPAIGIKTTGTLAYTLKVVEPGFTLAYELVDSRLVIDDSGEIPQAKSFRADLRAGIGLNLRLGRNVRLSPEVSYGMPLTTISDDDDWKAQAIHATVILKFDL